MTANGPTPDEAAEPDRVQLWLAPYGTPTPGGLDGDLDGAFRFAGMVHREVHASPPPDRLDIMRFGEPDTRAARMPRLVYLTLRFDRDPRRILPLRPGLKVAMVLAKPEERMRAAAPEVLLGPFTPDLHSGGVFDARAVPDDDGVALHWWFETVPA